MRLIIRITRSLSEWAYVIGGLALSFVMLLTVTDVILRSLRRPIIGTYEMVAFAGAIAIGFTIPMTSLRKGHVCVDILTSGLSDTGKRIFHVISRLLSIGFFLTAGAYLIRTGLNLVAAREVSPTIAIPYYPIAYGIGICCFINCLVLFLDMLGADHE